MEIDDSTKIISVSMIDAKVGTESELFEREGSRCHFNEVFQFKDYFIQLRLDWDDLRNGEPTLDADIWKELPTGEKRARNGEWHHTEKENNPEIDETVYTFEFQNLKLYLKTRKTVQKTVTACARIVDSVSVKLIKGDKQKN